MNQPADNIDTRTVAPGPVQGTFSFNHRAMATTFKVVIAHAEDKYARHAAAEIFNLLDDIEAQLSRYMSNSDISQLNSTGAERPLMVGQYAFECLELAERIRNETGGAFNVAVGSLKDNAQTGGKPVRLPDGTPLELYPDRHAARVTSPPCVIDLGGIGKGYALEKMAELLDEWDIESVLLIGGFSSILAAGRPAGLEGWPVTLTDPRDRNVLEKLSLCGRAMGASGIEKGAHIIDPRTGRPVDRTLATWVLAPRAGEADALSTAFMIMPPEEIRDYCRAHPKTGAVAIRDGQVLRYGMMD